MKIYLSIGSNIGCREQNIADSLIRINESIGTVISCSSIYETEPWGFQTDEQFLNIAAEVEANLPPAQTMENILKIESRLGRIRGDATYSSRIIDIDILLYGSMVVNEPDLRIPHPLMHERKFVLIPLAEIAQDLIHPVLNKTITELLQTCNDTGEVRKFTM